MTVRTRFAPSPTGYLHIGGLRTALYAYLYAKKNDGKFILRIEDTDQNRLVDNACEIIYRTLRDTGLVYDEGPDVGGDYGPYIQSERKEHYQRVAEELVRRGAAYYCFCTKERLDELHAEATARGEVFKYDKHCASLPKEEVQRRLAAGEPYVIRQNIPSEGESSYEDMVFGKISVPMSDMEDNILLKSDGFATYNLANVVDDHEMNITHVIRGVEYLSSTPKYNLIYDAMGWERPKYIHLPPVMRDAQHKLSKRHGDASYEDFIAKGYLKEAIVNYIALLGWSPAGERELYSLSELTEAFELSGLSKSPSVFDVEKLTWMNAQYLRAMSPEAFCLLAAPYLHEAIGEGFNETLLCSLIQPRLETLTQIGEKVAFLKEMPEYELSLYDSKKVKTNASVALPLLKEIGPVLTAQKDYSCEALKETLSSLAEKLGVKAGQLLFVLRVAISGMQVTPGGAIEIAALLGKEETLRRLEKSHLMLA